MCKPSNAINIGEDYRIRSLKNWYINPCANTITGITKMVGRSYPVRVSGQIIGYVDKHVLVQVCNEKYAFVLDCIDPCKASKRMEYMLYLQNLANNMKIIV